MEGFEKTITKILHDEDYKSDLIKRGTYFLNEYAVVTTDKETHISLFIFT